MVTVVTFAFKTDNKENDSNQKDNKRFVIQQWYGISTTSSDNPANQTVTGKISPPEEFNSEDCAQLENEGNFCAVLIEFPGSTSPNVTSGSVESLLSNNPGSQILDDQASNGYSRLPE